jgi:outer membrane receptor for ferrienterochelin and colicins
MQIRQAVKHFILLWAMMVLAGAALYAQPAKQDTAFNNLDEVIVTATKSPVKLGNVAVPVSVITGKTISQSGSLRLNDILNEQAGLFITSSYAGQGVQMQGFDPDYTLILIDGEPLAGRNSGVLNLARISVSNIKKIEIVKGPSSSLYGSEAMGGVINIITANPITNYANASARYGSFGTADINAGGGITKNKWQLGLQGNYYSTSGYNLTGSASPTQPPFNNYTTQLKSLYRLSPATTWQLSVRYFNEHISGNTPSTSHDVNINNAITHHFNSRLYTALHSYTTTYRTITSSPAYYDYFKQSFTRVENQTNFNPGNKLQFTAGGGWIFDNVASSRYDTASTRKANNVGYLFAQAIYTPAATWLVTGGLRYDYNQQYRSKLSPKLSVQKTIGSKISINASIGAGFKAPDFRQLYLNFTNTVAGTGYTVLGNTQVAAGLAHLQQQGLIQNILVNPATIKPLQPETSAGVNVGVNYTVTKAVTFNTNFFRNDISNLIVTGTIAQKTNNMFVYSYFNVSRAFTTGVETSVEWKVTSKLQASAGYQLLYTGNKDDISRIKNTKVYGRSNGNTYQLTLKDYEGLFNRSKHSANIKAVYQHTAGWYITARLLYRSGWGVADADGNAVLNRGDTFNKDYWQLNLSAGKTLPNGFTVQAGTDNLLNWKDVQNAANIPGRIIYATIAYAFTQKNKKNTP